MTWDLSADVVVIGYGAAGTALALSIGVLVQAVVLAVRLRPEFRLSVIWQRS